VLSLANRVGDGLSVGEESKVTVHFRTTARFEWAFWDMGYRRESWRV
jgi:thiaminase/transcriptional activator TenA